MLYRYIDIHTCCILQKYYRNTTEYRMFCILQFTSPRALARASKSTPGFVQTEMASPPEFVIQQVWDGDCGLTFLTSSQVMRTLLVQDSHFCRPLLYFLGFFICAHWRHSDTEESRTLLCVVMHLSSTRPRSSLPCSLLFFRWHRIPQILATVPVSVIYGTWLSVAGPRTNSMLLVA